MATVISQQLFQTFRKPNVAESYGPFASLAAAHAALAGDQLNIIGMTVGIQVDANHIEEYWYQGGTTQAHLVKKQMVDDIPASALAGDIPASKLSSDVQTSLGKADTAYQKPGTGIPASDLASAVQTSLGKADTAVQPADIAALDGNPTGTSADGHVSVQVTEVDGVVDAVNVTTNDIASASALAGEVSRAQGAEAALDAEKADKATTLYGYGITNAYTKSEVDGLVSTPHQNYVTVADYASLPATGSDDTIYRVSCWDGAYNSGAGQVDNTKYTEYAWNDTAYVLMRVMDATAEVFDISAYNNATYDDLTDALGVSGANVPADLSAGGISVKFINSITGQYEQYRLMSPTWSTAVSDWQGVDDVPTFGSKNLAKSGGTMSTIIDITSYGDDVASDIRPWNNREHTTKATFDLDSSGHNGIWHLLAASGSTSERINLNCSGLSNGKVYRIKFKVAVSDGKALSKIFRAKTVDGTTTAIVDNNGNNIVIQAGIIDVIIEKTSDWDYLIVHHAASQGHTYPVDVTISDFVAYEYHAVNDVSEIPTNNSKQPITSGAVANVGVINVSEEYPLQSGYYQITDSEAANFAPDVIPAERRVRGAILKIETSEYNDELYLFDGLSNNSNSWTLPSRWKRIANEKDLSVLAGGKMSAYSYTPVWTSLYNYAVITDSTFRASEKSLVLIQFPNLKYSNPLRIIKVNNVAYDVKHYTGRDLKLYELNETSIFEFVFKDGVFYLINPCAKTDNVIDTKDGVNLYDLGLLEIGGIITTSGQDSTNNKRIRTKTNKLLKSPCKIYIKDGYKLTYVYNYTDNGYDDEVTPGAKGRSGKVYECEYEGYVRLMFQSNDDSVEFSTVEDVGEVVRYSDPRDDVGVETLTLNNVENIITIGTSHTSGHGVIKNKTFVSYLSALYDWNFCNIGHDGMCYITALDKYTNNSTLNNGNKFSNISKRGGICLDFLGGNAENDYFAVPEYGVNMELNMKRLYSLLKSYGYDIIVGSYFGDQPYSIAAMQNKVARDLGLQFVDMNKECLRVGGKDKSFTPFYYSGHFATRTVANQFYPFWKNASIRRARTAIKIFRNRNSVADNSELLYNDFFERIKLWDEISINHKALPVSQYNYVDRLDQYVDEGKADIAIGSEYTTLKDGGSISVDDKLLVEFVLPGTGGNINDFKAYFTVNKEVKVYARCYKDSSCVIDTTDASLIFVVEDGSAFDINDTFTDSYYDNEITFTVATIDGNTLYCTSSEPVSNTPGQVTDTLTKSDSSTHSCTSITKGISSDYLQRYNEPFGCWKEMTFEDGFVAIDDMCSYMDYDKISLLIENEGGESFTISNIYAIYAVLAEKEKEYGYSIKVSENIASDDTILIEDTFALSGEQVGNYGTLHNESGNAYESDGTQTYTLDGVTKTKNYIPEYYRDKKSVGSILHLYNGDYVSYDVNYLVADTVLNEQRHIKVTLCARYFPTPNLDTSANSFSIDEKSFDFGVVGAEVVIRKGPRRTYAYKQYVPASFAEIEYDIVLDNQSQKEMNIKALSDDIELLYIKVEKLL